MVEKLIASGPVVIEEGRLILTKDSKDDFWKIPGGKVGKGESLEETAVREFKEETGLDCEITGNLSTMAIEEKNAELYHYKAKLKNKPKNFDDYEYKGHEVSWFYVEEIREGAYNVAPNVKFLIENGEI